MGVILPKWRCKLQIWLKPAPGWPNWFLFSTTVSNLEPMNTLWQPVLIISNRIRRKPELEKKTLFTKVQCGLQLTFIIVSIPLLIISGAVFFLQTIEIPNREGRCQNDQTVQIGLVQIIYSASTQGNEAFRGFFIYSFEISVNVSFNEADKVPNNPETSDNQETTVSK